MAATGTQVRSSNVMPVKAGYEHLEVVVTESAANATGAITNQIALGKSYRSVKPISATAFTTANTTSYVDNSANVVVLDNSAVKLAYKTSGPATIIAILECEV